MDKTNSAVENVMSQVKLEENPGLWDKFKNFAGTNTGRMLLGGLGSAATIGLMGGGARNALYAGVLGAGKTAEKLYNQEQDRLAWDEKEADRVARIKEAEQNRIVQKQMNDDRIQAQKDIAQTNYNKALDLLKDKITLEEQAEINKITRQKKAEADLYAELGLTPEEITAHKRRSLGIDNKLITLEDAVGYGKDLGLSVTPESLNKAISSGNYNDLVWTDKPLSGDIGLLTYMIDTLKMSTKEALDRLGKMTPEQKNAAALNLAQGKSDIKVGEHQQISNIDTNAYGTKAGIDFGYQQQGADAELGRDKEKANYEFGLKEQGADNALVRDQTMADYNSKIKRIEDAYKAELAKAEAEHKAFLEEQAKQKAYERDVELLNFKQTLPSQRQKEIAEMSIASGIPEKDIYSAMYDKMKKEADLQPTFGQMASAVKDGVVSPEVANAQLGQDVFQLSTKKKDAEEKALKQRQEQIAGIQAVDKQLDEFEALFDALPQNKAAAYTGGLFRDLTGTLTPEEAEFNAKRTLLFNKIARDLGGEKGVLSDQDIKRIEQALPTMYDNPQQRASKMAAIRGLVQIRLNQLNSGMPMQTETTSSGLQVGDVVDGYRYIGGEPSLESSWEAE